jgi:hypothetical protein
MLANVLLPVPALPMNATFLMASPAAKSHLPSRG